MSSSPSHMHGHLYLHTNTCTFTTHTHTCLPSTYIRHIHHAHNHTHIAHKYIYTAYIQHTLLTCTQNAYITYIIAYVVHIDIYNIHTTHSTHSYVHTHSKVIRLTDIPLSYFWIDSGMNCHPNRTKQTDYCIRSTLKLFATISCPSLSLPDAPHLLTQLVRQSIKLPEIISHVVDFHLSRMLSLLLI